MIIRTRPRRLLSVLLFCVLPLVSPATIAQTSRVVLILGDSISAAYGMSLDQGWVALLDKRLQADGIEASIVNASISGETSAGGLRRLPALLERYQPAVVVVELGANDGLRGHPLGNMQQNLGQIVSISEAVGAMVLLLPMEIPPNYGQRYTAQFRESFQIVAENSGAELGPFILDGFATDPQFKQADGIHPTPDAQPLMLDNVYDSIRSLLLEGK